MKLALTEWREAKAAAILHPTVFTMVLAEMILPDKAITKISRTAATVNSISSLTHAVDGEWGDLASYGQEALEVIINACSEATKKRTGGSKKSSSKKI